MKSMLEPYKWKILAGGTLLLSVWLFGVLLLPGYGHLVENYLKLRDQKKRISATENWNQKIAGFAGEEKELNTFLSDLSVGISENDRMSSIVEVVFNQAQESGIRIWQMRPQDPIQGVSFIEIPIVIGVRGRFHQLASFVNNLEQEKLLIKLKQLSLQAPEELTVNGPPMLTGELVISVAAIHSDKPAGGDEHG